MCLKKSMPPDLQNGEQELFAVQTINCKSEQLLSLDRFPEDVLLGSR
jgi:hypothetical protein